MGEALGERVVSTHTYLVTQSCGEVQEDPQTAC
jgi:hypothetical protein